MTAAAFLLFAALEGGGACPCPCAPRPGALVHTPRTEAFELNRRGREAYRARRWGEARGHYAAALNTDPQFHGPRLNLATAYAQEGRFADAVREAAALVERAYVPWSREVREAADLAPLHGRAERQQLERALAEAAKRWGAAVRGGVMFVARLRPPVRLPTSPGPAVLHLGLEQEIFAWDPATGEVRQVTAEDGRVLGFVRTADRQLRYLRAGKLIRTPGQPDRLRGLTWRRLDLETMAVSPAEPVAGDIERLELGGGLVLDGQGVGPATRANWSVPGCALRARDVRHPGEPPYVEIRVGRGSRFRLPAPQGAGLGGLPFPKAPAVK